MRPTAPKYMVRKLTRFGPGDGRDPLKTATYAQMADEEAYQVKSEESLLGADEIAARLEQDRLRPDDLVQINGEWTTLLASVDFGELAARRVRTPGMRGGLLLVALALACMAFTIWIVS